MQFSFPKLLIFLKTTNLDFVYKTLPFVCCLKSIAIVQSKTLTMHPAKAVANLTCIMCIILELNDFN